MGNLNTRGHDLRNHVKRLGPWFHNLHLPDGTQTAPGHPLGDFPMRMWRQIATRLPRDMHGWSVLDIGCNAGFYSIALAERGADVLGIDHDPHYLAQARWAAPRFDPPGRVEFRRMQVYDLARLDRVFDLVLFMGVLYHLRYPLLGLDIVAEKVGRLMVFQTMLTPDESVYKPRDGLSVDDRAAMLDPGWPRMAFVEHDLAGDPTNWWVANHAGAEAMLRSTGLRVTARPGQEIYLCKPDPATPPTARAWDQAELRSATGRQV